MSKALDYIVRSLAASGVAVCHHTIAMHAAPTDWYDGVQARGELASERLRVAVGNMSGLHRFTCQLAGIPDRVMVLARSANELARRIEWLTGRECSDLRTDTEQPAVAMVRQINERPAASPTDDRYAGRPTKEGPRTCGDCEKFTAGHACRDQHTSGLALPNPRAARRCLGFTPKFNSIDQRTGPQLWPELVAKPVAWHRTN